MVLQNSKAWAYCYIVSFYYHCFGIALFMVQNSRLALALSTILFHPSLVRTPPTTVAPMKKIQPRHWFAGPWGDLTPWVLTKHKHPLESPFMHICVCVCVCVCVWNRMYLNWGTPNEHTLGIFSLSCSLSPSLSLPLSLSPSLSLLVTRVAYSVLVEYWSAWTTFCIGSKRSISRTESYARKRWAVN